MTYRILTVELIDHVRLNKSAQRSTPSKPELQNLNWPPNFVDDDARILKCQDLRVLSRLFNFASWLFKESAPTSDGLYALFIRIGARRVGQTKEKYIDKITDWLTASM
jgi:hypothetical protein